jgi:hypothetical protein
MQQKLLGVGSVNIDIMVQLGQLVRYYAFLKYLVAWTTQELINQILAVQESSVFSKVSRPKLRATQPPIQWAPEAMSPGVKRFGCELANHLRIMPKLRMINPAPVFLSVCLHGLHGTTLPFLSLHLMTRQKS